MKPVYLEFCGINSFSEPSKIDFKTLLKSGVFGIFGDTGSGKSTILDSIHFALYGEIDRAPKAFNDCINYHCDGAYVVFDFEITTDGVRHTYRVRRERKRKTGTTKAYLYEYTADGAQLALAEGARDVDERIEQIVGLTFNDFKTCIALPQGDFAALVKSTTAERVKLVSRLFNLEKYGERLSKAVNDKYYRAEEEVNLIKARMSENEGGRDELIAEIEAQLMEDKTVAATAQTALAAAEEEERQAALAAAEKREYDGICAQLNALNARLSQMQEKRALIETLPKAQAVAEKAAALKGTEREKEIAEQRLQVATANHAKAGVLLERAKQRLQEGNFEEHILTLSVNLQKLLGAETDIKAAQRAEKELNECRKEFVLLKNQCPAEDFEGKKRALESEISALGEDDTLLDYLKHNYKAVLLADSYGEVRADLRDIQTKYPQTQEDIARLLEKYAPPALTDAQTPDIAQVNIAFKQIEQKRKQLKTQLDELEKRKRAFDENESKKQLLIERGKMLQKNSEDAKAKISSVKDLGTAEEVGKALTSLKEAQKSAQSAIDKAQETLGEYFAERQKQEGLIALLSQTEQTQRETLATALAENGFSTVQQAQELLRFVGDGESAKAECEQFFNEYGACLHKYENADKQKFAAFDETRLPRATVQKRAAQETLNELHKKIGAGETQKTRLLLLREKYKEQQKELAEKEKYKNLCDELRSLVKSNRFLEFIASEYLQEICVSASKTLLSLTGGRYFLRYEKEFKVGDNLDGGNLRGVRTLSGGETFLVSLSLALSLSGAICMKSLRPIEFFFLDEGFGTLDEKLVDTVMDVLGKLSKSFAVGLISHVEELKHRIESKILVTGATEKHGSWVRTESY